MERTNVENYECYICGEVITADNVGGYVYGNPVCHNCYEENTVDCCHCGTTIPAADDMGGDDLHLCVNCYDNYYVTCNSCGRVIHRDDAYYDYDEYFCDSCHEESRSINPYSYKPEPIFYGTGRFFGVELEIDGAGQIDDNAERILEEGNLYDECIYIKSDGSLDDGMEIVTHPMSLDYHMTKMPWKKILNKALSMGYLSHKTGTCGLHIHVDRKSLGKTEKEQEKTISNILFIIEKFWDEFLRFSRRTEYQLNRWASRYGFKEKPEQIMDNAKKSDLGRYACVNLMNYKTIEFRMWRGTLKYNTLIATLQMVEQICNVAFSMSEEELMNLSWLGFIERIEYNELITYLKERRLYFNEPVIGADEV